jgi:cardiolipin synthase A/B
MAGNKNNTNTFTAANKVQLIRGGKQYFNLLVKLINTAAESIHIQTYIFDDDETGRMVAAALTAAAKRKVTVYLLVDGYASQVMSKSFIHQLRAAGIQFRFFEPLLKSKYFYFGRRMHHKIVVVDMRFALVGGVNIANRYNDLPGKPAWLDFALFVEGPIAQELCILCWKSWNKYPPNMGITPCDERKIEFPVSMDYKSDVRMRRNDWVRRKNEISSTYIDMLRNAKTEVTILCSYFLPGSIIRRQIVNAIKRGVRIKVIASGYSDIVLAKFAERWLYDWLLRSKVELYEYQKNILHAKLAICDTDWITIGSYNINDISAYASIELNLDVRNQLFVQEVKHTLESIVTNDCIEITKENHLATKNIFKQFARWLSYWFIRVIFYLFTFYFKRRN